MKIDYTGLVTQIPIKQVEGHEAWDKYLRIRDNELKYAHWMNLDTLPGLARRDFTDKTHAGFELTIVSPGPLPEFGLYHGNGLTRRRGQKILRDLNCEPLTTIQTIQIATQTIGTGQLVQLCRECDKRPLVATVPINPEFPEFYYFGLGDGTGSFRQQNFVRGEENNLYFWWHENGKIWPHERYHFPLLMGVKKQ